MKNLTKEQMQILSDEMDRIVQEELHGFSDKDRVLIHLLIELWLDGVFSVPITHARPAISIISHYLKLIEGLIK